jgi:linearmycin/streptolysin S transport system permease protein
MKIIDIAIKDFIRSLRSKFAIGMMVFAPLVITGLIFAAFGNSTQGTPDLPALQLGVINLDQPPANMPAMGKMLEDMFRDPSVSSWLEVTQFSDAASARQAVDNQQVGMAVLIPPDFSQKLFSENGKPQLTLVQDPTLSIGPMVVKNMVGSFLDGINGARVTVQVASQNGSNDSALMIQQYQDWYTAFQHALFHEPQKAALVMQSPGAPNAQPEAPMKKIISVIMAGQMIFFAFYTGAYSMTSILKEEEEGTLARLFTTPTARTSILAGKFLAVLLTVIGQMVVLLLVGRLAFGVEWGAPLSVAAAGLGQVLAASGLGVLLIAFIKNSKQTGAVLGGGLTVLGMLGGLFTVAVQDVPAFINKASLFTPQGWVLQAWKLSMAGEPLSAMIPPVLVLVAMGGIMFFAGAAIFRQRFA